MELPQIWPNLFHMAIIGQLINYWLIILSRLIFELDRRAWSQMNAWGQLCKTCLRFDNLIHWSITGKINTVNFVIICARQMNRFTFSHRYLVRPRSNQDTSQESQCKISPTVKISAAIVTNYLYISIKSSNFDIYENCVCNSQLLWTSLSIHFLYNQPKDQAVSFKLGYISALFDLY